MPSWRGSTSPTAQQRRDRRRKEKQTKFVVAPIYLAVMRNKTSQTDELMEYVMRTLLIRLATTLIIGTANIGTAVASPVSNPEHLPPFPHITGYVFHPWCYDGTGNEAGVPICAYDSYAQCMANAGQCILSPYFGWPEPPRTYATHHHHTRA